MPAFPSYTFTLPIPDSGIQYGDTIIVATSTFMSYALAVDPTTNTWMAYNLSSAPTISVTVDGNSLKVVARYAEPSVATSHKATYIRNPFN